MSTSELPTTTDTGRPAAEGPRILEIRVHGVSNTPPAAMLGVSTADVEAAGGTPADAGFWTVRPAKVTADRLAGWPADRRPYWAVPPDVRREAYSWGGLARVSKAPLPGTAGLIRLFWVFLVPFGLLNAAFWARDLDEDERDEPWYRRTASGVAVRATGVVLTLLWVTTAATLTLGVAEQCYVPDGASTTAVCRWVPDVVDDALVGLTAGARTAVLAGAALVAFVVLAVTSFWGIVRYDATVSRRRREERATGTVPPPRPAGEAGAHWPYLARTGVWDHATTSWVSWWAHLAAGVALLSTLLAWQQLERAAAGCPGSVPHLLTACRDLSGTPDVGKSWATTLVLSSVVLVVAVVRAACVRVDPGTERPSRTGSRTAPTASLVGASVGVLGWVLAETWTAPGRTDAADAVVRFGGLEAGPAILVVLLVLLCTVGVGLRGGLRSVVWAPLVAVGGVASLAALAARDAGNPDVERWSAGVLLLALVALAATALRANLRQEGRLDEGWDGRGPAVFLALASGLAMVMSTATVWGVVRVLQPTGGAPPLWVPEGYREFASTSFLVVVALVLAVVVLAVRALPRRNVLSVVPGVADVPPPVAAVGRVRRVASLAHRAEPLVGWLAVTFWVALLASLLVRPSGTSAEAGAVPSLAPLWGWLDDLGTGSVVVVAGLLFASVGLGGGSRSQARPWGLLWDLECFLPHAGHPFGPPCYTERTVPELRDRIDDWLAGGPDRAVIVSAHSLGAVVSVATLLARWDTRTGSTDSEAIAFLSFGCQLRPYFGRFFPELLGPSALGTSPTTGAHAWPHDPWQAEPTDAALPPPSPFTLVGSLSPHDGAHGWGAPRWRSLWRRTDPLGFPVHRYAVEHSVIDQPDTEWDADRQRVDTHGGDFRTQEYQAAFDELARRMPAAAAPHAAGPAAAGGP